MNRLASTLLCAALSLCSSSLLAQTVVFDLSSREGFTQCTQECLRYDRDNQVWSWSNYRSALQMYHYSVTEPYYDDYLVTPELALEAGSLYRVTLSPSSYNSGKTGHIKIGCGQGTDLESYTIVGEIENIPYVQTMTDAEARTVEFNVPVSGNYKIFIEGIGNALYIAGAIIENVGISTVPDAVADLTVLPDPAGASSAVLIFTMPDKSISGTALEGQMSYRIYRDDAETAVKTGRANAGEQVSWTDTSVQPGVVTYSVEVVSGQETSARATITSFVGLETPNAVTGLTMTKGECGYTLSWSAPTKGIHDALIDPASLRYDVVRMVDGTADATFTDLTTTSYTDNYIADGLHRIRYSVTAKIGENASEAAFTETLTIGNATMPFAWSFAGADFGPMEAETVSGTYNWQVIASKQDQSPKAEPVDNDGGMAYYNTWSAPRGASARLMTPPVAYTAGDSPVIEFYICHHTMGQDKLSIQISNDGGDWTNVQGAEVTVQGDTPGWTKYSFPLSSAIADGCTSFRAGLLITSANGYNTLIDAIRVFSLKDKDLSVALASAPQSVVSGNDIVLKYNVANNGKNTVAASDYTLEMTTDYPSAIELPETVEIPSMDTREIEVAVPLTAIETLGRQQYSFALKVNYSGDEADNNNVSTTSPVLVSFLEKEAPANVLADLENDGTITVKWYAVADATYVTYKKATSFEDLEEGTTGSFDGWTSLDLDGKDGGTYYTTSGSAFKVVKPSSTPKGTDGEKCIGLTLPANAQQNDWLISPLAECPEGATMTLAFDIATRQFTSYYYYNFDVVYATGEYDAANPAAAFTHVVKSMESNHYNGEFRDNENFVRLTFDNIPAEAKYVALHFKTKTSVSSAVWIDNISLSETNLQPLLGYNIYEAANSRLNGELLPVGSVSYVVENLARDNGRRFFVTTVYPDGEGTPSDLTGPVTAIEQFEADSLNVIVTGEGMVFSGVTVPVTVYDLSGRKVATVSADGLLRAAPGIYIVKAGTVARKVMVK